MIWVRFLGVVLGAGIGRQHDTAPMPRLGAIAGALIGAAWLWHATTSNGDDRGAEVHDP